MLNVISQPQMIALAAKIGIRPPLPGNDEAWRECAYAALICYGDEQELSAAIAEANRYACEPTNDRADAVYGYLSAKAIEDCVSTLLYLSRQYEQNMRIDHINMRHVERATARVQLETSIHRQQLHERAFAEAFKLEAAE